MRTFLKIFFLFFALFSFGQKTSVAKFSDISIDSLGDLRWSTTFFEDLHGLSIDIEKQNGSKWTVVGGSGFSLIPTTKWSPTIQIKKDSVRIKFHKGLNTYRLVMKWPEKIISEEIKLISNISNDDGSLWIINNSIILDNKVEYEILDQTGTTISKGEKRNIDISSLAKGSYFFYTKDSTRPFVKK